MGKIRILTFNEELLIELLKFKYAVLKLITTTHK